MRTAYLTISNTQANAKIARERRDVLLPTSANPYGAISQSRSRVICPHRPICAIPACTLRAFRRHARACLRFRQIGRRFAKGVITIIPFDNLNLDYYSVRSSPASCSAKNEMVTGRIEKGQTEFLTTSGLAATGSELNVRAYVVLTTSNESNSTPIKITRT